MDETTLTCKRNRDWHCPCRPNSGFIWSDCADECVATCRNPNPNCGKSKVSKCICPEGTILDEQTNKCVCPTQCQSCPYDCKECKLLF